MKMVCTLIVTLFVFNRHIIFLIELFVIPPGFSRGLIFEADGCTVKKDCDEVDTFSKPLQPDIRKTIDLKSLVEQEQNSLSKKIFIYLFISSKIRLPQAMFKIM